jgi:hypothetical protein
LTSGFTKFFGSIVTSSIWCEDDGTFRIWTALLALADSEGVVEASVPGLAAICRKTVEETERALDKFMSPDPYSRTKDHEGRRIAEVPGGWLLLNHAIYRARGQAKDGSRAPYAREWRAGRREQAKAEADATRNKKDGETVTRNKRDSEIVTRDTEDRRQKSEADTDTTDQSGSKRALTPEAPPERPAPEQSVITAPRANPLVDRPKLEAKCNLRITQIAEASGDDPTAVLARNSTGHGRWKGGRKVNVAGMTDDRLANTAVDLDEEWAWWQSKAQEQQLEQEPLERVPLPAQEPEAVEIWDGVMAHLGKTLPAHSFTTWFRPLVPLRIHRGRLQVHAPNECFRDWLRKSYTDAVDAAFALRHTDPFGELHVEFDVFDRPPPTQTGNGGSS